MMDWCIYIWDETHAIFVLYSVIQRKDQESGVYIYIYIYVLVQHATCTLCTYGMYI